MTFYSAKMMIYRPSKHLPLWRRSGFLIGLALVLLLAGQFIFNYLTTPATALGRPLWSFNQGVVERWRIAREWWRGGAEVAVENETLRRNNQELQLQLLDHELLRREVLTLRAALGRSTPVVPRLLARVLSSPLFNLYNSIIVDLGRQNFATRPPAVGDLVVVGETLILGEIAVVDEASSKVRLFSESGQVSPVRLGPNFLPAEAKGRGAGNFLITVPRGSSVAPGDLVTVALPAGDFVLAKVGQVETSASDSSTNVFARVPLNLNELNLVEIIGR